MIEKSPHTEKLAPETWSKMKPFDLGLKAKRPKTKVSFGLENSTAVIFRKLREITFKGMTNFF